MAVQVDHDHGFRVRRLSRGDALGRDASSERVDVDRVRDSADGSNCRCCGHGCERGYQYFVARTDACRTEGQLKCPSTRGNGHAVLRAEPLREIGFERRQLSSEKEAAARRNCFRDFREIRGKPLSASTQVDDRYHG